MDEPLLILKRSLSPPLWQTLLEVARLATQLKMPLHLVGGAVRDLFLGRPLGDLDLAVEGNAIKLAQLLVESLGGKATTHRRFLTATWTSSDGFALDLASTRTETYAAPGSLPTIKQANLAADLLRRDFTINAAALALNGDHPGAITALDAFREDIRQRVLRILHPASFQDDPTRILRGVRYARRLRFTFSEQTASAIGPALDVFSSLSGERVRYDLCLILEEQNALCMLNQLGELGVLKAIDPDLPNPVSGSSLAEALSFHLNRIAEQHWQIPNSASQDLTVKVALILWLLPPGAKRASQIAARLDYPGHLLQSLHETHSILEFFRQSGKPLLPSEITTFLEKQSSLAHYAAWCWLHGTPQAALIEKFSREWRLTRPSVTADDLISMGVQPGPRLGAILLRLRQALLDGEIIGDAGERQLINAFLEEA